MQMRKKRSQPPTTTCKIKCRARACEILSEPLPPELVEIVSGYLAGFEGFTVLFFFLGTKSSEPCYKSTGFLDHQRVCECSPSSIGPNGRPRFEKLWRMNEVGALRYSLATSRHMVALSHHNKVNIWQ